MPIGGVTESRFQENEKEENGHILEVSEEQRYVGIKSLLDAVRITAAQVYVNTALMKLVLLMDFKENILSS
ncbi:hypothetical protein Tco_0238014 [Tanacetum coccineum]